MITFKAFSNRSIWISGLLITAILYGCDRQPATENLRQEMAEEIERELERKLEVWYPRVIDEEYGGYLSNFKHDWEQEDAQEKMIVTQARHLWTLSKVGNKYPDRDSYMEYAEHGFDFLKERMWDSSNGGFHQLVTREGSVRDEEGKTLYGNAFAIYGLAAYYDYSGDTAALDLAKETFGWLEEHSHDPEHGGYFQPLARDGTPDTTGYPKDYNSGIHILEALAELYSVWPDELVRERLEEMFRIVRDTITTDRGYMHLYFSRDWTPATWEDSSRAAQEDNLDIDHITFGHDIETAFLLLEAAHVLDFSEDSVITTTKRMTDHTIENAWDEENGGFYDRGYYFEGDRELTVTDSSKVWWAQSEALNTLLIMANYYPDDPNNYFDKFAGQWEYIDNYLIDHEHGGWYDSGLDQDPESATSRKSQIWKGNYHTVRTLLGCLERLKE